MGRLLHVFIVILLICIVSCLVYPFFDRYRNNTVAEMTVMHYPIVAPAFNSCFGHINTTLTPTSNRQMNFTLVTLEEWDSLVSTLQWPSPPQAPISAENATHAAKSSCTVLDPDAEYAVGDWVSVTVVARNGKGHPKTHGGDFFQAKLYNAELKASAYGQVTDHCNGTYTARLALPWPGVARVSVRLVHSSEAVQVLGRHRELDPDKVYFLGHFWERGREETAVCNAQRSARLVEGGAQCCCEFGEQVTGEHWLCRYPPTLPCSSWVSHSFGGYQARLSSLEATLLNSGATDVVVPGSDSTVNVQQQSVSNIKKQRRKCVPGLETPVPAGFYLQDEWTSLLCEAQSFGTAQQVSACLKDKQILMMGDSTLRQWFEHLLKTVPTLKMLNLYTSSKSGPFEAVDTAGNTRVLWRAHGLPIRTSKTPRADLHYIARELDGLAGGEHAVVVFTVWAHFTTHPLALYVRRLAGIRRAVGALLRRAPQTLVVIKSANTGYKDVYGSDWLSWQLDRALRAMFRTLPVAIIDVWQMTSCHYAPDNIHPPPVVVRSEVDLFLSFVCPK